jgi:hypothetical protein
VIRVLRTYDSSSSSSYYYYFDALGGGSSDHGNFFPKGSSLTEEAALPLQTLPSGRMTTKWGMVRAPKKFLKELSLFYCVCVVIYVYSSY